MEALSKSNSHLSPTLEDCEWRYKYTMMLPAQLQGLVQSLSLEEKDKDVHRANP